MTTFLDVYLDGVLAGQLDEGGAHLARPRRDRRGLVAVGLSSGLEATEAVDRVERPRTGLPGAVLAAAEAAPAPFAEDARRVATAVARQGHLRAPRLPLAFQATWNSAD